ncbi:hypothetical protein PSPO_a2924 [Pseudoalteromonas spongiae UST010723-006]|nr:hypothetical protein PSPO_a2924 [Pseudoalteromonas spongiae UST010723-006]
MIKIKSDSSALLKATSAPCLDMLFFILVLNEKIRLFYRQTSYKTPSETI